MTLDTAPGWILIALLGLLAGLGLSWIFTLYGNPAMEILLANFQLC
jgi:hypothetical protein